MKHVPVADLVIGNDLPLTVIAGPCTLESAGMGQDIAGVVKAACDAAGAQYIFKASYDKANRTSLGGIRGLGMDDGLEALQSIKKSIGEPILTDVHTEAQCAIAAEVADVLQIPRLLMSPNRYAAGSWKLGGCRQHQKGSIFGPLGNAQHRDQGRKHRQLPDLVNGTWYVLWL